MFYKELGLSQQLRSFFNENQITEATSVQKEVIPKILEGQSVLVTAQTGSGKTYSFAWPLLQKLKELEDQQGVETRSATPKAVVVAPTRELAVQLSKVFKSITHHLRVRVRLVVGGDKRGRDIPLEKSCFEILVGTPEKIEDQILRGKVNLSEVRYFILDEVDLLMDMGFTSFIKDLYGRMESSSVQVGLFGATLPGDLKEQIYSLFSQTSFEEVMVDGAHKVVSKVQTTNMEMDSKHKMSALREFLLENQQPGIVFFNTKMWLEKTYLYLQNKKCADGVGLIHGERTPLERKSDMQKFLSGSYRVLFATDIAARGIDVDQLHWVLNFDLPLRAEDYLHRCGRTARIGRSGKVYNFVTPSDVGLMTKIDKAIRKQKEVNLDASDKLKQRNKR